MIYSTAIIGSLEDRSILLKKALMVSQMVGINLKKVPQYRESLWARNLFHRIPIDRDADGFFRSGNFGYIGENGVF